MKRNLIFLLSLIIVSFFLLHIVRNEPLDVKATNGYPVHNLDTGLNYTTIQEAINANETLNGHTIFVEEGTHYENLVVNKSVSLIGENRSTTIIDGNETGPVVTIIRDKVNITGFRMQCCAERGNRLSILRAGISLNRADHCNITQNTMVGNDYGLTTFEPSHNNIVSENMITNNTIGIFFVASSNNSFHRNTIIANELHGIFLHSPSYNRVDENNITNNGIGIYFGLSWKSTFRNNVMFNNSQSFGVYSCTKTNDVDTSNTINGKPIYYWINVQNRTVPSDAGYVALVNCSNIKVENLTLSNNIQGMILDYTHNTTICGNTIADNYNGIILAGSSNNRFYHNNLINNTQHVSTIGTVNLWDNGVEGNYWDNYNGSDSDQDGIGDSWLAIDQDNKDNYPLMGMFYSFNVSLPPHPSGGSDYVNVISNSTVEHLSLVVFVSPPNQNSTPDQEFLLCYVDGENETGGFCRVMIPRTVLNSSSYTVSVDNNSVDVTELQDSNSTHAYIYFTYQHSRHEVKIFPEFPPIIILPLFMIATLLVVITYRRKIS